MANRQPADTPAGHAPSAPSPWVTRFAPLIDPGGSVLDVAAGNGRHARLMRQRGHPVLAVDREVAALSELARSDEGLAVLAADLEGAAGWPLAGHSFAGIVVTNYLFRPILDTIAASLAADGVLIYETFAAGNEAFGRPRNPDFLLRPGELLELARRAALRVVAYEDGIEDVADRRRVIQRICAVRGNRTRRLSA